MKISSFNKRRFFFAVSAVLIPVTVACSPFGEFIYWVEASNESTRGVLLLQVGQRKALRSHNYYSTVGIGFPIIAGLHPGVKDNTSIKLGTFASHKTSLPNEVEVVWQLAALTNCKENEPDSSYPGGRRKSGCTWLPLKDKIYRKTLDLSDIKQSEAYKKTGKSNPRRGGSHYTLVLNLIFNEDQVRIEAYNSSTHPWR
ncbi:MAG: hypothetical protein PHP86_07770 [Nevskiales bacterium]|nr:hypothetical protein [Nevskiales bacterium]